MADIPVHDMKAKLDLPILWSNKGIPACCRAEGGEDVCGL